MFAYTADGRVTPVTMSTGKAPSWLRARRPLLGTVGLFLVAVAAWGGYSHTWPWTGIDGAHATLWDWLKLLLLPTVIALAPALARADTRMTARCRRAALVALPVFAVLVMAGYMVPWKWTGFPGNTLWDWLGLTVLPIAVMTIPTFADLRAHWQPRYTRWTAVGLIVFGGVVLGGYLGPWRWTGFTGNTLWDWLNLLLLPLLIPTVLVPALSPVVTQKAVESAQPRPAAQARGDRAEAREAEAPDEALAAARVGQS